jgi:hypothetical protein
VRSLPTCDKCHSTAVSGVALSGLSLSGVSSRDRIDSPAAHSRVSDATGGLPFARGVPPALSGFFPVRRRVVSFRFFRRFPAPLPDKSGGTFQHSPGELALYRRVLGGCDMIAAATAA